MGGILTMVVDGGYCCRYCVDVLRPPRTSFAKVTLRKSMHRRHLEEQLSGKALDASLRVSP
jgi:hypothetical protein